MLRIKHLEDPFYIIFSEIKARPLRQDEPLGVGEIVLIFDPKVSQKTGMKKEEENRTITKRDRRRAVGFHFIHHVISSR